MFPRDLSVYSGEILKKKKKQSQDVSIVSNKNELVIT